MTDVRISRLAQILVNYSTKVKEGDLVIIRGDPFCLEAMPLFREVFREVLRSGGHPHITFMFEESLEYIFFSEASEAQIKFVSPVMDYVVKNYDCDIAIKGSSNTRRLSQLDPDRQSMRRAAYSELNGIWFQRSATKDLRWVYSLFPTSGLAQDADMSVEEFEDFVYRATFADVDDPVKEWKKVHVALNRLANFLQGKSQIEIKGPNVDLSLSIKGRSVHSADGTVNIPDGEVFTGPVEESVNGWIRFTFPAVWLGREVEGVELQFEEGKVVKASAKKNEEFLLTMLGTDEGATYVGEFAFGTNKRIDRFTKNILFDEKIGGTIHLALGRGYPETGSKNESAIHWDMICDMRDGGQVYADGELIYESGEFKLG